MISDYQEIGRMMMEYDKKLKYFIKNALKDNNLTVAEALVMLSLYESDGQTQEQMLSSVYYDKSVMTRTVQSLEKKHMIDRKENPNDKRSWLFHLTDTGLKLEPVIIEALRSWCSVAFAGMSDKDTHQLAELMRTVRTNINKE